MTHIKYLVLALATATAGAAPPSLRGLKDASGAETIGDAFELPLAKAVAENDATLAVDTMQKLRGAAEATLASRPAGRGLDFGHQHDRGRHGGRVPGHTYPTCK